jgi:hypothetical protein
VTLQRYYQRGRRRKVADIKFITAILAVIAHVDASRNISEPAVSATASEQLIHDTLEVDVVGEFYFSTFIIYDFLPLALLLFVLLSLFSFVTFTAVAVTTTPAISAVRHGKKAILFSLLQKIY